MELSSTSSFWACSCFCSSESLVLALSSFVNRVGELAEREGHHPDIGFGWGYCEVTLYTHKIKGLHENDFIMAAKINEFYSGD